MNLPTLTNWRAWEPNPIVVKELRQAVRSWAVTGMLLGFLTILFFITVGFLLGQSFHINPNQALGREIFQFFLPVLSIVAGTEKERSDMEGRSAFGTAERR